VCIALQLSALPSAAAPIIVGLPADTTAGNCLPFSCPFPGSYQQVYTRSAFPGPVTITGLEFYNTQINGFASTLNSAALTISLSTTSHDWNTLSSSYSNNIGSDNTQVFSGDLSQPWAFGKTLVIGFATPFLFDPANGNLLMNVSMAGGGPPPAFAIFFDTNGYNGGSKNGNTITGRVYTLPGLPGLSGIVESGYGLVTGFETGSPPVPEPAPLLLLGTSLGLIAARRRRPKLRA